MSRHMMADDDERTFVYADSALLKRIVGYLLAYKGTMTAVAVLVIVNIAVSLWAPFVLLEAIDVIFPTGDLQQLLFAAVFYMGLKIAAWLTSYGQSYLTTLMGQRAVFKVRQNLFQHLQT